MRKAVFLDRDGTINVEKDYLYRIEDFAFIPGAPEAIRLLSDAGYLIIVITNQSGVARGYYDESAVEALHLHIEGELNKAGTGIDGWYFCPHHAEKGIGRYRLECDCRKPLPGMIHAAAEALEIDLRSSIVVGDKISDIEAAVAAGCRPVLVRTGYGVEEENLVPAGVAVFDDLLAAARELTGQVET